MRYSLFIMTLMVATQAAYAITPSDFAYGYKLQMQGNNSIYSLTLPEEIYHGLTRSDRGDLRIFNGQGMVVPHYIKRAEQLTEVATPDASLPVFPLYTEIATAVAGDGHNAHIVTNEKGAIIDINYGKGVATETRKIYGYILDSSQLPLAPNVLRINWRDAPEDFVINVQVDGSDDLSHWRSLVSRATLSNLHYAQHALIQQTIDLPLQKQKYLRLSWSGDKPLPLTGVMAQFPSNYQAQERKWSTFTVTAFDESRDNDQGDNNRYYYFDTHSVLPVDRVNIELPQRNTLVRVTLQSSASDKGPWLSRYQGLLYNLQFEGNSIKAPDRQLSVTTHRYWRLRILDKEGQLGGMPQLRLGWIPEQLYFTAQGEPPFTLAYGSAKVKAAATPLAQLLNVDDIQKHPQLIKVAQLGSRITLGNPSTALTSPKPPADWKRLVLWGVLIVGVAALAFMALRLYKQMEQGGPGD